MVPVHLPTENHWLLVLISVLNLCLYIYDSARCTTATYRTIFNIIKEGFIRNELQWLSDEDKTTFQENNWDESTPQCPKQKNDSDCGVFTCFFAKHLLLSRGNHSSLTLNGEPRDKMVSGLLNLESALRAENDLPKVFQRTWQTASKLLTTENPLKTGWIKKWEMQDLLIPSPLPPKMATVCFMQCMTSYFVTEEHLRVPQNYAPTR